MPTLAGSQETQTMKIQNNTTPSPLPPAQQPRTSQANRAATPASVPAIAPNAAPTAHADEAASRSDRVEISDEARSRAAQLEGGDGSEPAQAAPTRGRSIAEIRQRIRDGVYDTDHALDFIARRILERGDL
jgi:hypothetical protein